MELDLKEYWPSHGVIYRARSADQRHIAGFKTIDWNRTGIQEDLALDSQGKFKFIVGNLLSGRSAR